MGNAIPRAQNHGHKDAEVLSSFPNTNFHGSARLRVGAWALIDLWRSFVEIPIVTPALPLGAVITNATIVMECDWEIAPIDYNIYAHEVLAPWDATTITWNTMPAVNPVPEGTVPITGLGLFSWDITALVQAWYAGTKVNNGICFIGEELIVDSFKDFASSFFHLESPRIYITYTAFADLSDLDAFLYVVEREAGGHFSWIYKIRKDDSSLTEGWAIETVSWPRKLAVNNTGYVHHGTGDWPLAFTLHKYEPNSDLLWAIYDCTDVYGAAVDLSGRIAAIGASTGGFTTWVYDSTGILEWAADHGGGMNANVFDHHGRVYTAGWPDIAGICYRKYEADGTPAWTILDDNGYYITVNPNEYVYITTSPWGCSVSKLQPDSTPVWTVQHGDWLEIIEVDNLGHVFIAGSPASGAEGGPADGMALRKLDTDGTILWSVAADWVFFDAPDPNGDIYLNMVLGGVTLVAKIDSAGNTIWQNLVGFSDDPAVPWEDPWNIAVAPGLAGAGFWPVAPPTTQHVQVIVIV